MKEIYVYKQMFGGWKGISKEEAEEKIKEGKVFGCEMEMDRGENSEDLKITLLKDNFIPSSLRFGVSDEQIAQLQKEYFDYVEEITGMETYQT